MSCAVPASSFPSSFFFPLLLFLSQLHVFPCRRPCLWTGHASLPGVSISAGLGAHPSSAPDASAASDARRFPADQSAEPTLAFPEPPPTPPSLLSSSPPTPFVNCHSNAK